MWRVTVTADFDTFAEAELGINAMFEAAAKHNGDVQDDEIEDLDADEEG